MYISIKTIQHVLPAICNVNCLSSYQAEDCAAIYIIYMYMHVYNTR